MARTSTVHYIEPGSINITPNAYNDPNLVAVSIPDGAKIKVFCRYIRQLNTNPLTNSFYEWTLTGRNRELKYDRPYTIYARLPKIDFDKGYLVFASKVRENGEWLDKYAYVTEKGLAKDTAGRDGGACWYIKLGDVSEWKKIGDNWHRTITIDTGILGTDQWNTGWRLDPDALPTRVEVANSYGTDIPSVLFDGTITLTPKLVEGFDSDVTDRVDHWTVTRSTGDAQADAQWSGQVGQDGSLLLQHLISGTDDFNRAASATFTFTAWEVTDDPSTFDEIASNSITILAETAEPRDRTYSEWVAGTTYYYQTINPERDPETGRIYIETSYVWHRGVLWMCLVTGTTQEPRWGSLHWKPVGGDINYYCEIGSSVGTTFRNGNVDTILTMSVLFGQEDITDRMLQKQGTTVQWSRKTGWDAVNRCFVQTSEDREWQATETDTPKSIVVVRSDMGSGWMTDYRQAMFCCSVYVPEGNGEQVAEYSAQFIPKV